MAIRTALAGNRRDPGIDKTPFGALAGGEHADLYTLRNGNGVEAKITNYGGIVVSLTAADRHGEIADVVLGFDNLDGYAHNRAYFGARSAAMRTASPADGSSSATATTRLRPTMAATTCTADSGDSTRYS